MGKGWTRYPCVCGGEIYEEWSWHDTYVKCDKCNNPTPKESFDTIDLNRFEDHYLVEFVDIRNTETLRSFDFSKAEIEDGIMKDALREGIREILPPNKIVDNFHSATCHVYVNGILVHDLRKELGLF